MLIKLEGSKVSLVHKKPHLLSDEEKTEMKETNAEIPTPDNGEGKTATLHYDETNDKFYYEYNTNLDGIKNKRIEELSNACRQHIINEFVASDGNGYRLTIEDQLNMQGQKDTLENDSTIETVDWLTIDDQSITHTRDEWIAVYKEAFQHKNEAIWKNKQLRDQVKAATTVDEVNAIEW